MLEDYIKRVQIESRIMGEMCTSHILPPAIKYQNILLSNIKGLMDMSLPESSYENQKAILEKISQHISEAAALVEQMIQARKICNAMTDTRAKAIAYCSQVKEPFFESIRYHVDKLELLVDDSIWLLPKYREMLFLR
jgi:glutamine synthetase